MSVSFFHYYLHFFVIFFCACWLSFCSLLFVINWGNKWHSPWHVISRCTKIYLSRVKCTWNFVVLIVQHGPKFYRLWWIISAAAWLSMFRNYFGCLRSRLRSDQEWSHHWTQQSTWPRRNLRWHRGYCRQGRKQLLQLPGQLGRRRQPNLSLQRVLLWALIFVIAYSQQPTKCVPKLSTRAGR